jgi:hypothetical protein
VIAEWYKQATGDRNIGTISVSRRLGQMIGEGQLQRLAKDPSHTYGRCFIWTGEKADPFGRGIVNDLQDRIDQERDYRNGGGWRRYDSFPILVPVSVRELIRV